MDDLVRSHKEEYGEPPQLISTAPGRVNVIGEHTDYNEGYVLPIAVDYCVNVAFSRRKDQHLKFFSADFRDRKRTSISNLRFKKEDRWANYPKGVISLFLEKGHPLGGLNLTIQGNVPQGVGLASSAALLVATGLGLQRLLGLPLGALELVRLTQEAEREFVGAPAILADHLTCRLARAGTAMLLDTRSLEVRYVPLPLKGVKFLITNSNVPHAVADAEASQRRAECEKCVSLLSARRPGRALRDYSPQDLRDCLGLIPETMRKKCLHVVEESQRVLESEAALKKGDLVAFGKLMNRSHESLRDQYEVSCPELDWLVKRAWEIEGVFGSRMAGAGFGGCTVTLIDEAVIPSYVARLEAYERIFSFKPETFVCEPAAGARIAYENSAHKR